MCDRFYNVQFVQVVPQIFLLYLSPEMKDKGILSAKFSLNMSMLNLLWFVSSWTFDFQEEDIGGWPLLMFPCRCTKFICKFYQTIYLALCSLWECSSKGWPQQKCHVISSFPNTISACLSPPHLLASLLHMCPSTLSFHLQVTFFLVGPSLLLAYFFLIHFSSS